MLEVTDSTVSYHRPNSSKTGIGLLGVLLGVLCLSLIYGLWPRPSLIADTSPAELAQLAAILIVPLAGLCGPTAIFLYEAGPLDLIINLSERTYRFRRGFPFLASWQSGSLDDIADLRVKTPKNRGTTYRLMVDWKNTEVAPWALGDGAVSSRRSAQIMFSTDVSEVRDEAQRLARLLGIPIKEWDPIWEENRRRAAMPLVLVPVILFFGLMGLSPLLVAHSLESEGQTVQGTVTELRHGKGLSVRYAYRAGTRVFQGSAGVPVSVYLSLQVGGPVSVRYLSDYPHTSTIAGSRDTDDSSMMLGAAAFFVVLLMLAWPDRRLPTAG